MAKLIRHGACTNIADQDGMTALYIAASRGWADVVYTLLDEARRETSMHINNAAHGMHNTTP